MLSLTPKKLERTVEEDCKKYAIRLGYLARKFSSPGRRAQPDDIYFRGRSVVLCEVKRHPDDGGKPATKAQKKELSKYADEGFIACWTDNIRDFKKLFDALEESYDQHHLICKETWKIL